MNHDKPISPLRGQSNSPVDQTLPAVPPVLPPPIPSVPPPLPASMPGHESMPLRLEYANPARNLSDGKRGLAWIGIMAGSVMTLVGLVGVAVGVCMLAFAITTGVTSDVKWVGLISLVCGLALLIPGYWICGKGIRRV